MEMNTNRWNGNKRMLAAVLAAGWTSCVLALAPVSDETMETFSRAAVLAARKIPSLHLEAARIDDALARDALDRFLSLLDFDHSIFLASDVESFRRDADLLDDRLRAGDLGPAFDIYDVYMDRLTNRIAFVDRLLDEGFDFEMQETYHWKRHEEPWPASPAEQDDLWRKKIKNLYLAQLVSKRLAEEEAGESPGDDLDPDEENLLTKTPEELIRDQFRQIYNVRRDNDADWLLSLYLTAFTRSADPHSDYMSARTLEDFDISMRLSLVGIGALLTTEDGAAKVERVIPGGPADRDGRLRAGDRIIAVGQGEEEPVSILHWPLSRSVRLIRGEEDTEVVLVVIPRGSPLGGKPTRLVLARGKVDLKDQAASAWSRTVTNGCGAVHRVGVVDIPEFYADLRGERDGQEETRSLTDDVRALLEDLDADDLDGLVIDLRNNGGGALREAIRLTGLFIPSGPVVQVRSRRGVQILNDPDPEVAYDGPLVILVNRLSASASEIFAGALKDYGRAVLVGDSKTHGKGTVQAIIDLNRFNERLGSLKVTTAGFYRINGGSTQKRGVAPHIAIPSLLDSMEIGEEYLPHALEWNAVEPALYRERADLREVVTALRERSDARRSADPDFQHYEELIDRLGSIRGAETISLNFEERLQTARREQELEALLKQPLLETERSADEDDEEADDLILREALHVLADWIALCDATPRRVAAD
jgi:carboxyl-terminal processing protease